MADALRAEQEGRRIKLSRMWRKVGRSGEYFSGQLLNADGSKGDGLLMLPEVLDGPPGTFVLYRVDPLDVSERRS